MLFVDNRVEYFISHRLSLAVAAQEEGYDVSVTTLHSGDVGQIERSGLSYYEVGSKEVSWSVGGEMAALARLVGVYRKVKPHIVHHVTLRGVLYGGVVARSLRVPAAVHGVTGLGYLYTENQVVTRLARGSVEFLLRWIFGHPNQTVTFQNVDDRNLFLEKGLVSLGSTVVIGGSGVDLKEFMPAAEPEGRPTVVMASRMLWHKGADDFVAAAERLKEQGCKAKFVLVGDSDPANPSSIPQEQLEEWHAQTAIDWWGYCDDMREVFAESHVVCLPTRYREGVPKVLIEAAAVGRPVVATDVPGCRDLVVQGETGLLVPTGNVEALARAIQILIDNQDLRQRMGRAARVRVEKEFSLQGVVNATLSVYEDLIGNYGNPQ